MIYRYKFSGMVVIPNNEEKIAMYLSIEIPVDYQTEEQAKQCPCSLRFESDENKEIVLKIYENFKQGLDDKKEYHCSVSGNVVATVHWNDRAKYKYHQSISENDVPEYEKSWTEIFETYIKSNGSYKQTVDSLAYGINYLDEKKIDRSHKLIVGSPSSGMGFETTLPTVIKNKANIIIAGPTGCGKTVFLSKLIQEIKNQNNTVTIFDGTAGIKQYFPEAITKNVFNGENVSKDEILSCKTDFVVVDGVTDLSVFDATQKRKGIIFSSQDYDEIENRFIDSKIGRTTMNIVCTILIRMDHGKIVSIVQ